MMDIASYRSIALRMREFIYFLASSAVAAALTAAAVVAPVPAFWQRVLWISAALVVLCAVWLGIDFLAEEGMGNWIGLSLPLWARAAMGAGVGAILWLGLTAWHSSAQPGAPRPQKQQSQSAPTSETEPASSSFMRLHAADGGRISGIHIDGLKQRGNSQLIDARAEGGGSITNVEAKNIDQTSSPKPDDTSRRR